MLLNNKQLYNLTKLKGNRNHIVQYDFALLCKKLLKLHRI